MARSMAQPDRSRSLWEITCQARNGHQTVHRVYAESEDDALDRLPVHAPDVVKITRTEVHGD